jgi:hypothetical protein
MPEKVPVMALKNKSKENRYLAASIDVGDWSDEDLDVSIDDIENAFMIWKKDFSKPNEQDVDQLKAESEAYKKMMVGKFGKDAIISFDVEKWLQFYEPVNIEITREQFENVLDLVLS